MNNINIQIGGHPHKDGEIDNPEFYYQAMDIINQHKLASEQARREREQDINKTKPKQETNILVYVVAVIIVCLLCIRYKEKKMKKNVTILCGTSGSGKDYILNYLKLIFGFIPLVSHTTRPMRPNETNGVDYNFVSDNEFKQMLKEDKFIEYRKYNTLVNNQPAIWYYGLSKTPLDSDKQHVVILDIQGTIDFIDWYGKEYCNIVLIKCDDEIRRERAKLRGGYEEEEFNRRLEDDKRVFSVDNMLGLIDYTIENNSTLEDLQLKCENLVDKLIKM